MNAETIKVVTRDCQRSDCRISSFGGISSMVHIVQEFDRNGNALPRPKPRFTESVSCSACGKTWAVVHGEDGSVHRAAA